MTTTDTIERLKEQVEAEKSQVPEPKEEKQAPKEEVKAEKSSSLREYVILNAPTEVGRVEAVNAKEALKKLGKRDGKYGVAPARNYSVFSIATQTVTSTEITPE